LFDWGVERVGELASAIDALRMPGPADLPDAVVLDRLRELCAARDALDGLIAEHLRVAEARDATVGDRGVREARWLQLECRLSGKDAKDRMAVARSLGQRPSLASALAEGAIGQDAAVVIARTIEAMPMAHQAAAEAELVERAREWDVDSLRRIAATAKRVALVGAKAEEAAQRRHESRGLTISPTFDGMHHLSGLLDAEAAATVLAALSPLAARLGPEDTRWKAQRMADALRELAGHALACGGLPDSGGERPQIMVTIDHETLSSQIRDAWAQIGIMTGQPGEAIRAEDARRIACDASVIPVLLGANGEVLDIGRASRTFTAAIRRAARLRDGGCAFPGCDAGLDRCELHHICFWSRGGDTSLANCCHLCTFHHWLVHTENWTLHRDPDGTLVASNVATGQQYRSPPRARAG
jgi:hypothetical protein